MYIRNEDTICAPATVPGTGAISVIRVSGPEALTIADKVITCRKGSIAEAGGYTLKFGFIYDNANNCSSEYCETSLKVENCSKNGANGQVIDEVLVSIFRAPHSYTGENSVEISCHASSYIVSSIMNLLYAAGARAAEPGEFTQRAYLNGKMDLAQAEAVADVIASQNAAAHRVAFKQMKGGFSSELKGMRNELLELVSLMELELDFSEEEVEFADRSQLDNLLNQIVAHVSRLIDSFKLGNAIKNGVPVAIAGATNTGKSTLLNALLGEDRAIVSDVHGTTRDTIEETLNIDGILFRFIDTAGLRETDEVVEQIGIKRTFKKIEEASIVLGMVDLTRDFDSTCETIREIISKVNFEEQILAFLLNKTDISEVNKKVTLYNYIVSLIENKELKHKCVIFDKDCSEFPELAEKTAEPSEIQAHSDSIAVIPISAKTGSGLEILRTHLASTQRDLMADSDTTLVTNQRHAQALSDARTSLLRVREGLAAGIPTDLAAQDIREAIYHLGSIVGEISTDEVLGNIFRNFCIGK
ncbi:MAG TPA: tRNA uridine-5-carboxymethylaminomethyl(34) synthesis GTPase MnmE [Methanocorpusculum sp.]|nr:tRNA uridine-5-carboxymethylaminomethyl(34) synthesis GTPase MnmE [Methanocorpusculum sp.]